MASGLRVEVTLHQWYDWWTGQSFVWGLGLYIYAPAFVYQNTEGLCGNYNGDPYDDLYAKGASSVNEVNVHYPGNFIGSYA